MTCLACGKAEVINVAIPIYADKFERDGSSYNVLIPYVSGLQCPICLEIMPDSDSEAKLREAYRTLSQGTLA